MNDIVPTSSLDPNHLVDITAEIVAAYVSNNSVPSSKLPALLSAIHASVAGLSNPAAPAEAKAERITPGQIRKSIGHDALISFEDGKSYKTLKRHLGKLGLSPAQYCEKWGLPRDYPMVAASYSETRSALAKSLGLGQQRRNRVTTREEAAVPRDETPGAEHPQQVAQPGAGAAKKPARPRKSKQAPAP